jgi:hypothetical protein
VQTTSNQQTTNKRDLRLAKRSPRNLLSRITKAQADGEFHRASQLASHFLNSFHAKLVSADIANRKLPSDQRQPLSRLGELAREVDMWSGSPAPR